MNGWKTNRHGCIDARRVGAKVTNAASRVVIIPNASTAKLMSPIINNYSEAGKRRWQNIEYRTMMLARRARPTKGYKKIVSICSHRLRAEQALSKPLPHSAVVHHVDGSKNDNTQLVICQDQAYHMLLHQRTRIVKAGGNPNTDRVCSVCRVAKNIETSFYKGGSRTCKECKRATRKAKTNTNGRITKSR